MHTFYIKELHFNLYKVIEPFLTTTPQYEIFLAPYCKTLSMNGCKLGWVRSINLKTKASSLYISRFI